MFRICVINSFISFHMYYSSVLLTLLLFFIFQNILFGCFFVCFIHSFFPLHSILYSLVSNTFLYPQFFLTFHFPSLSPISLSTSFFNQHLSPFLPLCLLSLLLLYLTLPSPHSYPK